MTVVTISIIGLVAVLLAVQLKGVKGEYGVYLVVSADVLNSHASYSPELTCFSLTSPQTTWITIRSCGCVTGSRHSPVAS